MSCQANAAAERSQTWLDALRDEMLHREGRSGYSRFGSVGMILDAQKASPHTAPVRWPLADPPGLARLPERQKVGGSAPLLTTTFSKALTDWTGYEDGAGATERVAMVYAAHRRQARWTTNPWSRARHREADIEIGGGSVPIRAPR